MKNVFLLTVSGLLLLASCGNNNLEQLQKENAQLRMERDSLLAKVVSTKGTRMDPLPIDAFKGFLQGLQNAQSVRIPVSLKFEEEHLTYMLSLSDAGNHKVNGLLGYPILENGFLKIALVPYYEEGGEIKHFETGLLGAYNYSQMCPPNVCATNAPDLFGVGQSTYDFHK
jgi:hypothetical protein